MLNTVKSLKKAANQGNADAQNSLGDMYYYGEGVVQNYAQAVKWLQKAANQGNADAQNSLGDMYYYGEGVAKNYAQAVKWLQKAANQGNADAQNSLGDMYYYGEGVAQNYTQAVKWLQKAADQGNADAQNSLDNMYYGARDYTSNAILTHYDNSIDNSIKDKQSSAPTKAYGYYACSCGAWWESAHSWTHETQDCKQCGENVYPYRQEELQHKDHYDNEPKVPHREDLCGMCRKLGRSCTLEMSASGNERYPNDVLVKGLPMNINELQLIRQFSSYGTILRINIPEPKKDPSSRVAFITFEDRETAIQKFYNAEQGDRKHKLRLL
jgi:hypothetical protein